MVSDHTMSVLIQRRKVVDDFVLKLQNLLDKNEVSNMVLIVRYNDSDLSTSKSIYEKLASKIHPWSFNFTQEFTQEVKSL